MDLQKRLSEIEGRLERATPGPWRWTHEFPTDVGAHLYGAPGTPEDPWPKILDDGSAGGEYTQSISGDDPDAQLIAHAPDDLRLLLALVKEYRAALEFYSNQNKYFNFYDKFEDVTEMEHDCGQNARQALARGEGKG